MLQILIEKLDFFIANGLSGTKEKRTEKNKRRAAWIFTQRLQVLVCSDYDILDAMRTGEPRKSGQFQRLWRSYAASFL